MTKTDVDIGSWFATPGCAPLAYYEVEKKHPQPISGAEAVGMLSFDRALGLLFGG
ncbi:MAG: hypothetical protein OES46_16515 [Gammaproteobacteria bacterium]|nr:hypothetical protein [Gammaproteobacteria bacterium]